MNLKGTIKEKKGGTFSFEIVVTPEKTISAACISIIGKVLVYGKIKLSKHFKFQL